MGQVEFIMLGRAIPKTISRLQNVYDRLAAIRERMPEIKRSDAVLTYFAKSTYFFTQDCLNNDFQKELATFPIQLGYETPKPVAIPEPAPECASTRTTTMVATAPRSPTMTTTRTRSA